jgi:hypothetical protein
MFMLSMLLHFGNPTAARALSSRAEQLAFMNRPMVHFDGSEAVKLTRVPISSPNRGVTQYIMNVLPVSGSAVAAFKFQTLSLSAFRHSFQASRHRFLSKPLRLSRKIIFG